MKNHHGAFSASFLAGYENKAKEEGKSKNWNFKKIFSGLEMTKEVTISEQISDGTTKKEALNDASGQVNFVDCNLLYYNQILIIHI